MAYVHTREPSVDELKREAERTRAGLTDTVDELRARVADTASDIKHRVSPAAIKAEVKDYVHDTKEQLLHNIERRARENPLQAVAIGAGLAYPMWRIVSSIPAPIMLIGAGLLLARPVGANSHRQDLAAQARDKLSGVADAATDRAREAAGKLQGTAEQAVNRVADSVAESVDQASAAISSRLDPVISKATQAANDTRQAVSRTASEVAAALSGTASSVMHAGAEAASTVTERATELGYRSRESFFDAMERNPLLVAGIGVAIGAFIAASLPASDAENRLLGPTSDEMKDRAREAASRGLETAKGAASDLYDEAARAAEQQGLTPDALKQAAEGLTDKVRSVADRGLNAIEGQSSQSQSPSPQFKSNPSQQYKS